VRGFYLLLKRRRKRLELRSCFLLRIPAFALILDEAVRMTDARYEELGKVSKEDVGNSARLARMMSQNEYPIGHENPAGWDGQKLTDDEAAKITKFCAAQNPAIDFLDECNWYLAYLVLNASEFRIC